MIDEGYIKFNSDWEKQAAFEDERLDELLRYRQLLYGLELIGAYPDGIGYGNISLRLDDWKRFYISGSKTGNYAVLGKEHFAKVTDIHVDNNWLSCVGPIIASSESMTHASVYKASKSIGAVIHVHSKSLWDKYKFKLPTTAEDVAYGTPRMAYEVLNLVTQIGDSGIIVMAGHEEGIIAFGADLETAYETLKTII